MNETNKSSNGVAQERPGAPGVTEITVGGADPYPVVVGRGVSKSVGSYMRNGTQKILIVHQPSVRENAEALRGSLGDSFEVFLAEVPDAEAAKRVEVAAFCWQIMGQANFTRTDAVVALGGGAVTDLAGFVAATWLRGVQCVLVPSTILGMVDAAIGGKTGINTNEGKNLVGTFTAPVAVIVDLDLLVTLPRNEIVAGFAEIVKAGFIYFPEILDVIEADVERATDTMTPEFRFLVERAIEMKARVVSEDFRESGLREILNYGHTLGHAIEHAERYKWRHGAAIAVGMVFAAELARIAGSLSDEIVDRHRRIFALLGLPTAYPAGRWDGLLATMRRDKKSRGAVLRFVVLDSIGRPSVLVGPEPAILIAAFNEISATS